MRKNSFIVPCALVGVSGVLVIAYHVIFPEKDGDAAGMKAFLIILMMSMFPLAYLDATISKCRNPMALFDKFGLQVILMHSLFLTTRAISQTISGETDIFNNKGNIVGAIASFVALIIGFHDQLGDIFRYGPVAALYLLAFGVALVTVMFSPDLTWNFIPLADVTSEYGEVLAWLPAAWVVFMDGMKDELKPAKSEMAKRRTLSLAFFIVGFYVVEDLVTMFLTATSAGFEAFAHLLHFALLVDFGLYVILDAFDPEKGHNTVLSAIGDMLV
jgi:hypothetical protein